jgi:hypothetical protein
MFLRLACLAEPCLADAGQCQCCAELLPALLSQEEQAEAVAAAAELRCCAASWKGCVLLFLLVRDPAFAG